MHPGSKVKEGVDFRKARQAKTKKLPSSKFDIVPIP